MTDNRQAPLLDLDTLIERPRIAIDETLYEILSPNELSVIDSHRFAVWGRRIDELKKSAVEGDENDEAELEELIAKVARKICVGVPDDVFAKVQGKQRWAVIDVFTALLLRTQLKVAGAMVAATGPTPDWMLGVPLTGASSFHAFSGSTADARKTGWRRFLPHWFAPS
jgi:hypothetical protein